MKKAHIFIVVLLAITTFLVGASYFPVAKFGVSAGTDHYNAEVFKNTVEFETTTTFTGLPSFNGGITSVGDSRLDQFVSVADLTVATGGSTTTTAAVICNSNVIQLDPEGSINWTLPTTASLVADCATTAGDKIDFILENTANGAETITIVAGTGMDLMEGLGETVVIGQNDMVSIEIWILSGTTSIVATQELQPAD